MRLQTKIILALAAVLGISVLLNYGVHEIFVTYHFRVLEDAQARKDMARCRASLVSEISHLAAVSRDWAFWNDTYEYVADPSEDYETSNLLPTAFEANGINLIHIYDRDGRLVWGRTYLRGTNGPVELAEFTGRDLPADSPLRMAQDSDSCDGVMRTSRGPMLVAAHPILSSDARGPSRGTFVMGRFLDRPLVDRLSRRLRTSLRAWVVDSPSIPAAEQRLAAELDGRPQCRLVEAGPGRLLAYRLFYDIHREPCLLLRAELPRDIAAAASTARRYVSVALVFVGLVVLVATLILLDAIVVRPLRDLTRHTVSIGEPDAEPSEIDLDRRDEIGSLTREFASMTDRLNATHEKRVEALRILAGGVAHDLNNILTPVLAVPPLMRMGLQKIHDQSGLDVDMIQQHMDMIEDATARASELVSDLLTLSRPGQYTMKRVALSSLLRDVIENNGTRHLRDAKPDIDFVADIAETRPVVVSPVHLHRALDNIIRNAFDAMNGKGRLTVSVRDREEEDVVIGLDIIEPGSYSVVTISDTGEGMTPEAIPHIFEPFFTKKPRTGSSGTGLGLAIVHRILEDHHAGIRVLSELGAGTTFELYFAHAEPDEMPAG